MRSTCAVKGCPLQLPLARMSPNGHCAVDGVGAAVDLTTVGAARPRWAPARAMLAALARQDDDEIVADLHFVPGSCPLMPAARSR